VTRATLVAVGVACAISSAPAFAASSYVQVVEREYSLVLSRPSVGAGAVPIEALNLGMDAHNLVVGRRAGGPVLARMPKLFHGALASRIVRLTPGRYVLWCTLPGHRARGMRATLVVR